MKRAAPENARYAWYAAAALAVSGWLLSSAPAALGQPDQTMATPDEPDNPRVRVATARGEFQVELYREAAPASVEWFLTLAGQQDAVMDNGAEPSADSASEGMPAPVSHYAGQHFDRILPGVLIQSSGPLDSELPESLAARAPAPEINAALLGLDQQPLLEADGGLHSWLNITGRRQFEDRILTPLYREMGITDRETLAARSDEVTQRLQESTVADAYRWQGYRYDEQLLSRPPRTGSVLLLAATPQRSSAAIAVTLTDTYWLRGQHTVIGQVVDGMSVVRALGSQPRRGTPPATIYRIETDRQ